MRNTAVAVRGWRLFSSGAILSLYVGCTGQVAVDGVGASGDAASRLTDAAGADSGLLLGGGSFADGGLLVDGGNQSDAGSALDARVTPDAGVVVVNPNALFVSTDGSDSNDGRTEAAAMRTIQNALDVAMPGETVYVKAGDYGAARISFPRSGSEGAPITVEGFQKAPGDRPMIANFDQDSPVDPSQMPLLRGNSRGSGTAVSMSNREHVRLYSIQTTEYVQGVNLDYSDSVVIENSIFTEHGARGDAYSGAGIWLPRATGATVRNSVVVGAGGQGVTIGGSGNLLDGVRVYEPTNSDSNGMDYYMVITGDGNTIRNCLIWRGSGVSHLGHGYSLKGTSTNHVLEDNLAVGIQGGAFEVRHRGVQNNVFRGNEARDGNVGFQFREGASNNVVENHRTVNMHEGVSFTDTHEDGNIQDSGHDNIVRDSEFAGSTYAIRLTPWGGGADSWARRNTFENIVIDGADYLIRVDAFGENNVVRNSTIKNVQNLADGSFSQAGFAFENITEEGNGFGL